jgi:hypothetical protein
MLYLLSHDYGNPELLDSLTGSPVLALLAVLVRLGAKCAPHRIDLLAVSVLLDHRAWEEGLALLNSCPIDPTAAKPYREYVVQQLKDSAQPD